VRSAAAGLKPTAIAGATTEPAPIAAAMGLEPTAVSATPGKGAGPRLLKAAALHAARPELAGPCAIADAGEGASPLKTGAGPPRSTFGPAALAGS
jgi:hypothetical protein